MRLAFSLPVHERDDVVLNSIENIRKFNPGCAIVLHVSQLFRDFRTELFSAIPDVHINPNRFQTKHGKGFMRVHCSNYRHLEKCGVDFTHFCLIASNEMFVRAGLADYVNAAGSAFQAIRYQPGHPWHLFARGASRNPKVLALLRALNTDAVYGGQTEGQFFARAVFDKIASYYELAFGDDELNDFETEELVPQTVAMALQLPPHPPFTLVDYLHTDFEINIDVVRRLADPTLAGRMYIYLGPVGPDLFPSPHHRQRDDSIFSVKRINRSLQDPVRQLITQLPPTVPVRGSRPSEATVPLLPGCRWRLMKRSIASKIPRFLINNTAIRWAERCLDRVVGRHVR